MSTTGDHLHTIIKKYTGQDYKPGCGCRAVVAEMNSHPPQWSLDNIKWIIGKLKREANRRSWWTALAANLPGATRPLRWMIKEAVRLAEKDAKEAGK